MRRRATFVGLGLPHQCAHAPQPLGRGVSVWRRERAVFRDELISNSLNSDVLTLPAVLDRESTCSPRVSVTVDIFPLLVQCWLSRAQIPRMGQQHLPHVNKYNPHTNVNRSFISSGLVVYYYDKMTCLIIFPLCSTPSTLPMTRRKKSFLIIGLAPSVRA
jgi:hypothetical protein